MKLFLLIIACLCAIANTFSQYCTPIVASDDDTYISSVKFGSIDNNTTGVCADNSNFLAISANVVIGNTYPLTITTGDCDGGGTLNRRTSVFIDWNGDEDFTDAGEMVHTSTANLFLINEDITVPAGAVVGTTRMRVITKEGLSTPTDPCAGFTWGEIEEYTIIVQDPPCTSTALSLADTHIENVTLAGETTTINNSALNPAACANYTNYTNVAPADLAQSSIYSISVTPGTCNSDYSRQVFVYFDFNQDGDFTGAGETFGPTAFNNTPGQVHNLTFTIPATASLGYAYMRIQITESSGSIQPANGCSNFSYGEVEDYLVNIVPPTNMVYENSTVSISSTEFATLCLNDNKQLIRYEVTASGSISPIQLSQINLDFTGTTDINDIDSYEIFYTGLSPDFATTSSFASGAVTATTLNATGTQQLVGTTNYFWIVVNLNPTSPDGNIVDLGVTSGIIAGANQTPTVTNPVGTRTIKDCPAAPGGVTSSSPELWVKANDGISEIGGDVSAVTNHSIYTINTSVPAGITNPVAYNENGHNFNPKMEFNVGHLELSDKVQVSAIFSVAQLENLSRTYTHLATHNRAGLEFDPAGSGNSVMHGGIDATFTKASPHLNAYSPFYFGVETWRFNGVKNNHDQAYSGITEIVASASASANTYVNRIWGGQDGRPARDWIGDAHEMVIFQEPLVGDEVERVESYLAIKYGLTLGVNGTSQNYLNSSSNVVWNIANNNGFNYDIAGIMRDDKSALNQVKSHTENFTAGVRNDILTIANGTSFTKNSKAVAAFSSDKASLVWGHNNLSLSNTGSADIGATDNATPQIIEGRFNRVWKSEERGTLADVVMEFDFSSLIQVGSWSASYDLSAVRLLIDEDGTFATGATAIAPSSIDNVNNKVYFTHNFDGGTGMAKGFFFTIGSTNLTITPLPVESLSSTVDCEMNRIKWSTLSETNTSHFLINTLDELGNVITTIEEDASGNTSTETNYSIYDRLENDFYRIEVVNIDGSSKLYGPFKSPCSASRIHVYPNPFDAYIQIDGLTENATYTINNLSGKLLTQGVTKDRIDTQDLIPGIYLLTVNGNTFKIVKK